MTSQEKIIKNRIGLLRLAEELGNVSQACKYLGYSRDTFYRYKEVFETGGIEALREESRRGKPNFKNRICAETEARILTLSIDQPAWGPLRMKNELLKEGISISTSGIRGIWNRHGMGRMEQRLEKLEEKAAKENLILTESQHSRRFELSYLFNKGLPSLMILSFMSPFSTPLSEKG